MTTSVVRTIYDNAHAEAQAAKTLDVCARFSSNVHQFGLKGMCILNMATVDVKYGCPDDKKQAVLWGPGAVTHFDFYNQYVNIPFCAGTMGGVWADVYLAGATLCDPTKFVLKRARVAVYEQPTGPVQWQVLLDASFDEQWLADEVRIVDEVERDLLVRKVEAAVAAGDTTQAAYEQCYEFCYDLGQRAAAQRAAAN